MLTSFILISIAMGVPAPGCVWTGHCFGDPCVTYNDCDGEMICLFDSVPQSDNICVTDQITVTVTVTVTVTEYPEQTSVTSQNQDCLWAGHCLNDPCVTYNDCDGEMVCIFGV